MQIEGLEPGKGAAPRGASAAFFFLSSRVHSHLLKRKANRPSTCPAQRPVCTAGSSLGSMGGTCAYCGGACHNWHCPPQYLACNAGMKIQVASGCAHAHSPTGASCLLHCRYDMQPSNTNSKMCFCALSMLCSVPLMIPELLTMWAPDTQALKAVNAHDRNNRIPGAGACALHFISQQLHLCSRLLSDLIQNEAWR